MQSIPARLWNQTQMWKTHEQWKLCWLILTMNRADRLLRGVLHIEPDRGCNFRFWNFQNLWKVIDLLDATTVLGGQVVWWFPNIFEDQCQINQRLGIKTVILLITRLRGLTAYDLERQGTPKVTQETDLSITNQDRTIAAIAAVQQERERTGLS